MKVRRASLKLIWHLNNAAVCWLRRSPAVHGRGQSPERMERETQMCTSLGDSLGVEKVELQFPCKTV